MSIEQLKQYKEKVDPELEIFFNEKIEKAKNIDSSSVEIIQLLKEYTLRGGKRIRAAMVHYGYLCLSDQKQDQIIKASMCIELIQSFLLIHDDIIDKSDLRRGNSTLHKSYESICKNKYPNTDANHFSVSMAIIAGDILVTFANEILTKLDLEQEYKISAIRKLNQTTETVIYGQVLDVFSELKPITKKQVEQIQKLKTASYTIEGPLHIGALLAGANEQQLKILSDYGMALGTAFQIQDDILGMFGDEEKVGKPCDSDLKEGKQTLLILKALEKASEEQKDIIKSALGNPNLTKEQLEQVRQIIKQTSSLEYSQNLAKQLIEQAKSVIINYNFKQEGKDFLIEIADYMLKREY